MKIELQKEIEKFKVWSENFDPIPESERNGEWELLYEEWDVLEHLFYNFIETCDYKTWRLEDIKLILYLIARNNECENFINTIAEKQPESLELLAQKAFEFGEPNAKWQIATRLDKLNSKKTAQFLLEQFFKDKDQYVKRRALMKMAALHHPKIEIFCKQAWNIKDEMQEYFRIAVLHSLKLVNSPKLEYYLQLAIKDGRKYLIQNANQIKETL